MIDKLFTLKEAAEELGVHPTTLRRWADNGEVPLIRTPGGHRRFSAQVIADMKKSQRQPKRRENMGEIWGEQALVKTRQGIKAQDAEWLKAQSADSRLAYRQLGQQLLAVIMQSIGNQEVEGLEEEAKIIGRSYAEVSQSQELSLSEALKSFLFFRDMMTESSLQLPDSAKMRPATNQFVLRRINEVLNLVQLEIVNAYTS